MTEHIGIHISTRNRAPILDMMLYYFVKHWPNDKRVSFIVTDDVSTELKDNKEIVDKWNEVLGARIVNPQHIEYRLNSERLGIAKNKNAGLRYLYDQGCDYFFMFDDDCCPQKDGWADIYVKQTKEKDIHHLMHLIDIIGLQKIKTENGISEFRNCGGVMLYFTRKCIDKIGGYNPKYNIYGGEHFSATLRAYGAEMMPGIAKFSSPAESGEYIYSLDFDLNNKGINPPDHQDFIRDNFVHSLADEAHLIQGYINKNNGVSPQGQQYHEF